MTSATGLPPALRHSAAASAMARTCLYEVGLLQGEQGVEGGLLLAFCLGQDEPLDQAPPLAQEHVLGPAQPDPLGSVGACPAGVGSGVGVRTDRKAAGICVAEDAGHRRHEVAGLGVDLGGVEGPLEQLDERGSADRDGALVESS
jgi:hypothetical protein